MSPQTILSVDHVQPVLEQVHQELRCLLTQRAEIIKRIGTIKKTVIGIANLFGEDTIGGELLELIDRQPNPRERGFTRACRWALMDSDRPLLSKEVVEKIHRRNPVVLAHHKDPVASVTTVLNRLANYGEAQFRLNDEGRRVWWWVSERDGADNPPD